MPELGQFSDYCAYTVVKEPVGNGGSRVFGPWSSELQAKADKKRQGGKGRTCTIVEQNESPDPDEVVLS